ncbi:TPA: fibronectin type III domain-containing protein, partial [Candidatus Peregrinibacteria bacterium]|nr:fibronectin type III domain-containing protein [Candidatus Peregrinibacteria bacterium]
MKDTHNILVAGATSALFLSVAIVPTFAALEPAGGPLDDLLNNVATETAENTALKVMNLSVLPAKGKATLIWDPVKNADTTLIAKYKISYGTTSVEEGLAEEYDDSMKLELNLSELETVGVARSEISGLKNGEKYFFSVQAIDADGNMGARSEEHFTTPSLSPVLTDEDETAENLLLELEGATALTTTIIKAVLIKDVVLSDDDDLRKKLFLLNLKADEETTFSIKDVVFKENYLRDENSTIPEIEEGSEIYIILEEAVEKDVEYQLTASARLKDVDGKSINNGV